MQLTEKWLKETLERNPQLKVKVQGGQNSELEQPEEVEKTKTKYGNHRVYLYEDEYVSGDKYISGHGKLVAVFDSTKEYCRWLDLQLMEKAGTISNLERQKELVIQDAFMYEKKRVQRIVYKADFCYLDAPGQNDSRRCERLRFKVRQVHADRGVSVEVETPESKVSRIPFRVSVE